MIALNDLTRDDLQSDDLTERKRAFLDAAASVRPLDVLRRRPWVTVGAAAAVGAVVGSGPFLRLAAAVVRAATPLISKAAVPLVTAAITGKMAHDQGAAKQAAAEAKGEPGPADE